LLVDLKLMCTVSKFLHYAFIFC